MYKLLLILPWLTLFVQPLNAKIEAANYNSILRSFNDFFPGKKIEDVERTHGKGETTKKSGDVETKKFMLAQMGYKFPVMVQFKEGVVLDFFARLPSFLPHDPFHRALLEQLGKQTSYQKVQEEAVYTWEKAPLKYIYSGACTITCFTVFYAVGPLVKDQPTIIEQMQKSSKP